MDADYLVYGNSKKVIEVFPSVNFVTQGGRLSFANYTADTIVVQQIAHLVNESVNPIVAGDTGIYTIRDDAKLKGGHLFKVKVHTQAVQRGEDVQLEAVASARSGDPEIIIL